MSVTSVPGSPSSSGSRTSPRLIACALPAMIGIGLLAWEYQSSGLNSPPWRWLFPGIPFLLLAGLILIKRIPLGVSIGACFGGLVPVAVLYRAMFLSMLNYNGGGADIGIGLLGLAVVVLLPFAMLIGGLIGWMVAPRGESRHSNGSTNARTPTA